MSEQAQSKVGTRAMAALLSAALVVGCAPSIAVANTAYADEGAEFEAASAVQAAGLPENTTSAKEMAKKATEVWEAFKATYADANAPEMAKALYTSLLEKAGLDEAELMATAQAAYESLSEQAKAVVAEGLPAYQGKAVETWEGFKAAYEGKSATEVAQALFSTLTEKAASLDASELYGAAIAAYQSLSEQVKAAIPSEVGEYLAKASEAWDVFRSAEQGMSISQIVQNYIAAASAKAGIDYQQIMSSVIAAYGSLDNNVEGAIANIRAIVEQIMKSAQEGQNTVKDGDEYNVNGSVYKVLSAEKGTVALKAAADKKKVVVPAKVELKDGKSYTVKKIAKGAFKSSKATKVVLKTKALAKKKAVKGSLKGSKVNTVKVPAKKLNAYKKVFTQKIAGKAVTLK